MARFVSRRTSPTSTAGWSSISRSRTKSRWTGLWTVIGDVAEEFAADPEWSSAIVDDPQVLGVDALDDSGVVIRVLFTTDPDMRWNVKREFLRRVKNGFDEAGIEIPYPHVTITRRPESS